MQRERAGGRIGPSASGQSVSPTGIKWQKRAARRRQWPQREERERRPNREPPAHAPGARELAVIKISSDSGLMHEMMADDCRRRRRMILVRDLAMVATLFNCRGRGFEICFLIYVPVLNYSVEDEEDEKS